MKLREIRKELGELRGGDDAKLIQEVAEMKREQFNLRFQRATGQLDKPLRLRDVRRMVARAKTVLREKRAPQKV